MLCLKTTSSAAKICRTICSYITWKLNALWDVSGFYIWTIYSLTAWLSALTDCRQGTSSSSNPTLPFLQFGCFSTSSCAIQSLLNSNQFNSTHFYKVYFDLYLFSVGYFINYNSSNIVPNQKKTKKKTCTSFPTNLSQQGRWTLLSNRGWEKRSSCEFVAVPWFDRVNWNS